MNATVFSILKAKLLWEVVFPTRPSALRCEARCCLCRLRGRGQHHSASRLVLPRRWFPAVLPSLQGWDKGMKVANKD